MTQHTALTVLQKHPVLINGIRLSLVITFGSQLRVPLPLLQQSSPQLTRCSVLRSTLLFLVSCYLTLYSCTSWRQKYYGFSLFFWFVYFFNHHPLVKQCYCPFLNMKTLMGKKRFRMFHEIIIGNIDGPHVSNVYFYIYVYTLSLSHAGLQNY